MNACNSLKLVAAFCFGSLGLATYGQTSPADVPSPAKAAPSTQAKIQYGQLPLSFEPNRGQTSSQVQWLARGPQYTLYLAGTDAVLQLTKITPAKRDSADPRELQPSIRSSAVRMNLLGASFQQKATGEEPQSGKANYFTGNDPSKWQRDVPMYGKVRMNGVYPGVDLVYYGRQGALEYDFVVAPDADAAAIKLSFDGSKPTLAANGDLVLPVDGGPEVRFNKPVVYQIVAGVRHPVDGSFAISAANRRQQVSFQLGPYDHSRELVIDPTLLFLGVFGTGNYETQAIGMAVDASGEIILTGETSDVDLPVNPGAYQTTCNQDSAVAAANHYVRCGGASEGYLGSAFVTKISADGTSLVYSTYLHGLSGSELGQAVAADAAGDAIVLGQTGSSDFPVTADAIQPLCMPYYYPIGVAGGSPADFYQPAAQHCDGNFAGGGTEWVSGGPTLFVAKLDPTGANLLYSTFFGGTQPTYPNGLALDTTGNIYFTSYLQSQGGQIASNYYPQNGSVPFPVTANALQTQNEAVQMATLSVLSADGHTLLYSTLYGATNTTGSQGWVQPLALAVGPNGMAYVGGETYSDAIPTTAGSVRPGCVTYGSYNNQPDNGYCEAYTGWLAAFNTLQSGQNSLQYGTYIGGPEVPFTNPNNIVYGLAADGDNNVYITGNTYLTTYPTTTGAYQTACLQLHGNAGQNYCSQTAFLTKINPTGSDYVWSTLFEGNQASNDYGQNIGFDTNGNVYLFGYDNNYTFDLPWVNPLQGRPGSNTGASYPFLATFSPDGTKLLFSTPLGNVNPNAGNDFPVGMVLDSANNIYFAGYGADNGTMAATAGTYSTAVLGGSNRTYFGKISPLSASSTTTLSIAPATAITGQTVTFTATVAGATQATPTPTGTVTLTNTSANPATTLGTITLSNGTGTFTSSTLAVGTYSVTANYSGDSTYEASTSTAQSLVINPIATATSLTVAPAIAITGANVSMAAIVSPATGTGIPTGTVTFKNGATQLAEMAVDATGKATFNTTTLALGSYSITAAYSGDSSYASSTSTAQSLSIQAAPTPAITLSFSPTSINLTQPVTVTISVSGGTGKTTPTGSVTLSGGGYTSAVTLLANGTATITIPANSLKAGSISFSVTYTGDSNYSGTSGIPPGSTPLQVAPAPLIPTVKVAPASATPDSGATLSVPVTVSGSGVTPTGTVTLSAGSYASAAASLTNGTATITIPANSLSAGSVTLTAAYSGDATYAAGTGSAAVTVTQSVFTLAASTPAALSPQSTTTSTVTASSSTGYDGSITLACALQSSPTGAVNPPSCTPGSSAISLSGSTTSGTATVTISTGSTTAALVQPKMNDQGTKWIGSSGAVLAILVFLGIPARRRSWRAMLGVLALMAAISSLSGCGGKTGTTPGTYTFTVTGSGSPAVSPQPTATFTVTVN